ncbi:MAG TPA: DcaP family trimeric outer membrane transporter [Burkholderiales bacterium]|nr:DcaP family trimeric outer membrane transporter [Burkholderiales bacterium]
MKRIMKAGAPIAVAAALGGFGSAAYAESKPTFRLPGTDTTVTLGGYIKLDAILSDKSAGVDSVGDQMLSPSLIPVGPDAGAHKKNQVTLHARQTRLSFATSTPTSRGDLTTYVEGDFFGDLPNGNETSTNSSGFRLRHAYGALGGFSAGQYWTNLFNQDAYPETLDFGGALGELFVRQAQVRWTQPFGSSEWSVSAENPESVLAVPGKSTTFRSDSDHVPDLIGRVKIAAGRGLYSIGVLAREIHVDSPAAPAASSGEWGGAVALTAIVPTIGKDDLRMDLNFGNAIGRYQVGGFFPDGYVDTAGQVRLARQASGYIAYRHFWSPTLRSTLELSAADSAPPTDTFPGINKADRSQHLNLIWRPVPNFDVGAELIHARREVTGGDSGTLNRLQFSAQFGFL